MPAKVIYQESSKPQVTVVIPSLDGSRDGNVDKLINELKNQTFKSIEIILSINESPNGHARNVGIEKASSSSQYFCFFDDDVSLGSHNIISNFINGLSDNSIGMVGASQIPPYNSNLLEKWIAYDLNKAKFPMQKSVVDTEMATHAGLGITRELWDALEGEDDNLVTGTDTDLRQRIRDAGYRVVVVPNTLVYHPMPSNLPMIFKSAIRNGAYQVFYMQKHGFQSGFLKPFSKINNSFDLIFKILTEIIIFLPHIFYVNRKSVSAFGFRPINAIYRFLMVCSYAKQCLRENISNS